MNNLKPPYRYIREMYGLDFRPGERVALEITNKPGTVAREDRSVSHYVQVRFDGQRHLSPCHPGSLIKLPAPQPEPVTGAAPSVPTPASTEVA